MGRGRAKAKQQKVARELKYNSQSTDLTALQRELAGYTPSTSADDDNEEYADPYAEDDDSDDWVQAK